MMSCLRNAFVTLMTVLLFACSSSGIKQDVSNNIFSNNIGYVDVDSDIESDFSSAVILLNQKKFEEAITVLNSVIEREQRLPAPYVNLAMAYSQLGDVKLAEENLISALKLDISHPTANNELGLLYRKAGKFNAARIAYENAISVHASYLPAKRNLGVLCDLYMHDYKCAQEQFERYLELQPDDKEVAIWVEDVKRRQNR